MCTWKNVTSLLNAHSSHEEDGAIGVMWRLADLSNVQAASGPEFLQGQSL